MKYACQPASAFLEFRRAIRSALIIISGNAPTRQQGRSNFDLLCLTSYLFSVEIVRAVSQNLVYTIRIREGDETKASGKKGRIMSSAHKSHGRDSLKSGLVCNGYLLTVDQLSRTHVTKVRVGMKIIQARLASFLGKIT